METECLCPPMPTACECRPAITAPREDNPPPCEKKPLQQQGKNNTSSQRALSNWQLLSYGVGHVLNDLAAAMWFSYLLLYLTEVEHFQNVPAGNLMLIGQVADGICTPLVGMESDRTRRGFCNLGKRKSWHFVGTICTLLTFPFIFEPCITCSHASSLLQMVYYAPFVVIFQFGWASVQISHLSYSSEITPYEHERVILQSIRNFFTVFANIAVFGIFSLLFILGPEDHSHHSKSAAELDSSDIPKFRYLTIICLCIGIVFNVIFYLGTAKISPKKNRSRDRKDSNHKSVEDGQDSRYHSLSTTSIDISIMKQSLMSWKDWLREHQFYQIGLLYMFTRLFFNISQVYFGIYLTKTIRMKKMYVAILPLVLYGSSFMASIFAPSLNKAVGRKLAYVVGVVFGVSANVWLFFMAEGSDQVYGAAMFLGITDSLILITSLSMVSDLIASNVESGAFVFGAMSFTDKLSNGLTILIIQKYDPCSSSEQCGAAAGYYRYVESLVPGGAILSAFVVLLTLIPQTIGTRRKKPIYVRMNNPKKKSSTPGRPICTISQDEIQQNSGSIQYDGGYEQEEQYPPPAILFGRHP